MTLPRTVIFDLDGTLADTSGDLLAAANTTFADEGHAPPLGPQDALTAFHGGRAMLRAGAARLGLGWSEEEVGRRYPRLLAAYRDAIDTHTRLYPGAVAAVERLRARGDRVGICTNKPDDLAELLLARLGVRDLFAAMVGARTLPVAKPDPAPLRLAVERAGGDMARALLVGDTITDRRTAAAAGVPVVLVTFGPQGRAIAELQPEGLLDHYDGLEAVVDRLLGT
ncbi:MAG: HAD-IA family hydrolase [Gemmobacter sp.]|uniref:HAD-IA family hydrolase n=1 Tax=Gemmobacter sp. TaxID=1898957 RepID=UPI00391CE5ED